MITVRRTSRICICGDSISSPPPAVNAWGGLVDWISLFYRGGSGGNAGRGSARPAVALTGPVFVNASVPGDDVQKLDDRVNADVVALSPQPTIVLIATAVNLILLDPAEFTTRYNSILNKLVVGIPGVQIACATIFCLQDTAPNTYDSSIIDKNGRIVTAAAVVGATVVDTRTPFLAAEAPTNPGHLSTGALTVDGLHPNPTGCALMSNTAKGYFTRVGP